MVVITTVDLQSTSLCRYARGMISGTGSTLFEELGLYYIGPVDGHNMEDLVAVLQGGWVLRVQGVKPQIPINTMQLGPHS